MSANGPIIEKSITNIISKFFNMIIELDSIFFFYIPNFLGFFLQKSTIDKKYHKYFFLSAKWDILNWIEYYFFKLTGIRLGTSSFFFFCWFDKLWKDYEVLLLYLEKLLLSIFIPMVYFLVSFELFVTLIYKQTFLWLTSLILRKLKTVRISSCFNNCRRKFLPAGF